MLQQPSELLADCLPLEVVADEFHGRSAQLLSLYSVFEQPHNRRVIVFRPSWFHKNAILPASDGIRNTINVGCHDWDTNCAGFQSDNA
jgi:hypothetical protein